jgi:hypothetical protein
MKFPKPEANIKRALTQLISVTRGHLPTKCFLGWFLR